MFSECWECLCIAAAITGDIYMRGGNGREGKGRRSGGRGACVCIK